MKKIRMEFLANAILIVFLAMMIISFPAKTDFWGGLILGFSSAGLIGGLADWFAIKSFFAKPLGLNWPSIFKTEMIPKNREVITNAIVDVIKNKIITRESLKEQVEKLKISDFVIDSVFEETVLKRVINDVLKETDSHEVKEVGNQFKNLLVEWLKGSEISLLDVVEYGYKWMDKEEYSYQLISFFIDEANELLEHPLVKVKLRQIIENVKVKYVKLEGNSGGFFGRFSNIKREIFFNFLPVFMDLTDEILTFSHEKLFEIKREVKAKEIGFKELLERYVFTNNKWYEFLKKDTGTALSQISIIDNVNLDKDKIFVKLEMWIEENIGELKKDGPWKPKVISILNEKITGFLYKNIELLIKNKVGSMSNEMLTEEIYSKVGDDLNAIRINGSIIGGLVGAVTFLLLYFS